MTTARERQDAITTAMHENLPGGESAMVIGWVAVAEYMDADGRRWLCKANSDTITEWNANGLHHEALYGEWPDPDEDDD